MKKRKNVFDTVIDAIGFQVRRERLPNPRDDNETLLEVVGYKQNQDYTCGYAAGLMVLHTFYPKKCKHQFLERVRPHKDSGVSTTRLAKSLRDSGLSVRIERGKLSLRRIQEAIETGMPVITTIGAGNDIEHWVVIFGVGYRPNRVFIAGNGFFGKREFSWAEFRKEERGALTGSIICWAK
jgi:ABC-type bacteriocin/lantibiotic exporter with double-glycine peptidase domain